MVISAAGQDLVDELRLPAWVRSNNLGNCTEIPNVTSRVLECRNSHELKMLSQSPVGKHTHEVAMPITGTICEWLLLAPKTWPYHTLLP